MQEEEKEYEQKRLEKEQTEAELTEWENAKDPQPERSEAVQKEPAASGCIEDSVSGIL